MTTEGIWVAIGQITAIAGALAGMRLITEILNPAAYGELALGLTMANLANQTIMGPLGNGISRYYAPAAQNGDLGGYLHAVRRLMIAAGGAIIALGVVVTVVLAISGHTRWVPMALASLAFALFSGYNTTLINIHNAARQRLIVSVHQGLDPWLRFAAATLLAWTIAATSTVAMVGFTVASIVLMMSQWMLIRRSMMTRGTRRESSRSLDASNSPDASNSRHSASAESHESIRRWTRSIWHFAWPFSTWGLFSWAQQSSDRWALETFATTASVGEYAVLYQLGFYPTAMAAAMLLQLLSPIFFEQAGDASDSARNADVDRLTWRVTWIVLVGTAVAALVAALLHRSLFSLFAAREYGAVSYLLPWMLIAGGMFAAGQAISMGLMSQLRSKEMIVAKIVTCLLGIAFNVAGAYLHGLVGVTVAGCLFSIVYFSWMARLSTKSSMEPSGK